MTVTSWTQTPAGVLRRGGVIPETATMDRAAEITSQDRLVAKRAFDEAWAPVVTVQQALAEAGWQGAWIHVGHTVPPELAPLYAQAAVAQTRSGVSAPGHQDPLIQEHAATVRERMQAVQARLDAVDAPGDAPYRVTRSVAGPSGDDDGW